jgi:hypothetical protein
MMVGAKEEVEEEEMEEEVEEVVEEEVEDNDHVPGTEIYSVFFFILSITPSIIILSLTFLILLSSSSSSSSFSPFPGNGSNTGKSTRAKTIFSLSPPFKAS